MVDFPGADFGEVGSEDISRPLVAQHDGILWLNLVLHHGLGEFLAEGLLGPPHTRDINGIAEFLHHFFAAVV